MHLENLVTLDVVTDSSLYSLLDISLTHFAHESHPIIVARSILATKYYLNYLAQLRNKSTCTTSTQLLNQTSPSIFSSPSTTHATQNVSLIQHQFKVSYPSQAEKRLPHHPTVQHLKKHTKPSPAFHNFPIPNQRDRPILHSMHNGT